MISVRQQSMSIGEILILFANMRTKKTLTGPGGTPKDSSSS